MNDAKPDLNLPFCGYPKNEPSEIERLRDLNKDLLEACEARIDEWHADSRNFTRNEPPSLTLIRAAIRKAERK